MKEFFNVETIEAVLAHARSFAAVDTETVALSESLGRVLAEDVHSDVDIPDFNRSTMDGFAVKASSTFGASEANPAYLNIKGQIPMGVKPDFAIGPGEAARIATGGMLPEGADSVIMVEHTDAMDDTTIEAYRSVARDKTSSKRARISNAVNQPLSKKRAFVPRRPASWRPAAERKSPCSNVPLSGLSPPETKWCLWTGCPAKARSAISTRTPFPVRY